jgi:hypothetical protein
MRGKSLITVFAAALPPLVCAIPALAAEWARYANPRFGTSAEIPLDGFAPIRRPKTATAKAGLRPTARDKSLSSARSSSWTRHLTTIGTSK